MSVVAGTPREVPSASPAGWSEDQCAHCGSQLAEDQEWCLECGAARTLIHRPPDWRIPVVAIGVVVLLVLVSFAIALVSLSGNANRSAQASSATPKVASAPEAPAAPVPSSPAIADWPTGLGGWTVVLSRSRSQTKADDTARRIGAGGTQVGVLDSSRHPSMAAGYWIVFSGRYPNRAAAATAAASLRAHRNPTAVARRVAPPGGI